MAAEMFVGRLALLGALLLAQVLPCSGRLSLRKGEAGQRMPDPSAIAAPFFPFVGRVAVLTPKDKLQSAVTQVYKNMPNSSSVLPNVSSADIFGSGHPSDSAHSSGSSGAAASKEAAPEGTGNSSEVLEDAESPLLAGASGEVKAQVAEAMAKAKAEGNAEIEEAVEEAKEKWVSEARVLELEDAAKMDEAVRHDLADSSKKVEAVRSVQIHALQNMAQGVKAAMANITDASLEAAVDATRRKGESFEHEILDPSLRHIIEDEGSVEHLRAQALRHLQVARGDAQRLGAAAAVAESLSQNITDSPEDLAKGLREHVAAAMSKARTAKESAEATKTLAEQASRDALELLSQANSTEAEAQSLLDKALAQAKEIQELEERTTAAQKQAAVTELLRKAGLVGEVL